MMIKSILSYIDVSQMDRSTQVPIAASDMDGCTVPAIDEEIRGVSMRHETQTTSPPRLGVSCTIKPSLEGHCLSHVKVLLCLTHNGEEFICHGGFQSCFRSLTYAQQHTHQCHPMPRKAKDVETDASTGNSGGLYVTDQQSRFHTEATEHSSPKEITVKDLSVSIGNREILSHAELHLQPGRHYVLAGRNGIGKSTLLHAIATDQVPSIPRSLRVLLLGQTEANVEDGLDGLSLSEQTVLQCVVRSDRKRERLMAEARTLSAALENSSEPIAAVQAFRKISHQHLEDTVSEARLIATRRSGARGKTAREKLIELEGELDRSQQRFVHSSQPAILQTC